MYRMYEDPHKLEERLEREKEKYERMKAERECGCDIDDDDLYNQYLTIYELEDRINFAWQDDEYEENYRLYGG